MGKKAATLRIENLSVYYDQQLAVNKVTLDANPNEILALVGPSGCGKSSILASINRMNMMIDDCRVTGRILINSENVLTDQYSLTKLRQKVGMVFQSPNPFPMSVKDNICFPLKDHGLKSKKDREVRMFDVLQQTGLWDEVKDRLNQSALKLSGGQQQRLCIARALALKPQLLLLDEPCSALDPKATEKIEILLQELKSTVTIVMVTHNLAQAKRIAERVAVCWSFNGSGRIVECSQTDIVFNRPASKITEEYFSGVAG
ncbi:phosphate ABC transporter ATP-binding protein [Psychromonas sp. Urea-02u-13]|nr:phosphate ABC transporter ATP-binding protein [Psychromonas sp. Urea-02u-13]